jgi:hypothetical protein
MDGIWRALPREVAGWWRERDAGQTDSVGVATLADGVVHISPEPAAERMPPVENQI